MGLRQRDAALGRLVSEKECERGYYSNDRRDDDIEALEFKFATWGEPSTKLKLALCDDETFELAAYEPLDGPPFELGVERGFHVRLEGRYSGVGSEALVARIEESLMLIKRGTRTVDTPSELRRVWGLEPTDVAE